MFKNTLLCIIAFCVGIQNVNSLIYDSYSGKPINKTLYNYYKLADLLERCTNEIEPCDPNEPRRINGSCNNLLHPSRGAINTPLRRVLPPEFFEVDNPRKSQCGDDLPLVRKVRTDLLCVGKGSSPMLTQLATHKMVFMAGDVTSIQDTVNYLKYSTNCCDPENKIDPYNVCYTHKIPSDDPVHRYSHHRCMNHTKSITFQKYGCKVDSATPARLITATNTFDLSNVYDFRFLVLETDKLYDGRSYVNGSLKHEIDENGLIWPPSAPVDDNLCSANDNIRETRCNAHVTNSDGGSNMFTIWYFRNHLKIADYLAKINPCWSDDKIFYTAVDINIAIYSQIMFYELFAALLGYNNMVRDGVLSDSPYHRDIYDESLIPSMSEEYVFAIRWFHTMQDSTLKMYDRDGNFVKTFPVGNLTLRTGYFAVDDNYAQLTQGSFRQPCGNNDLTVHPDMSEISFGPLADLLDVFSNDLAKSRMLGFPGYVKYKEFFTNKKYETFDDLADDICPERLERVKDIYCHVGDIDLMAGMWLGKHIPGGQVTATVYNLMVEQLYRSVRQDRFWYENPNRPNPLTTEQLLQIRKATVAKLLCEVGDGVTKIQPHAFYRIGPNNTLCNCEDLPGVDLDAWLDESCSNDYDDDCQ